MRKHTILQADCPYNVCARCINREWFTIPMDTVWKIFCQQLWFIHHAFEIEILAFVLMSNHFHMIVRTPLANISDAMAWFMREVSRELNRAGNRENMTFGGRHFKNIMTTDNYFQSAYKYLYHNPIHAGMCENILDYPYSTLPGLLGKQRLLIPVQEDLTLFDDVDGTLRWINERPTQENWEVVERAIHRREFKFPRLNNRPHPLENDTL